MDGGVANPTGGVFIHINQAFVLKQKEGFFVAQPRSVLNAAQKLVAVVSVCVGAVEDGGKTLSRGEGLGC